METDCLKLETLTRSVTETRALGRRIGNAITGGLVIALTGDLGSGKTAFVQGLAKGIGVPDADYVTSPTYSIIHEYSGRLALFHMDLYRINDSSEAEDIGIYDLIQPENLVAIEWPEMIASELPKDHLSLFFEIQSDTTRKISICAYGLQAKSVIRRLDISTKNGCAAQQK
ncbi:MAG: tRNA (adenosine(37)-N6)-threonylcarbamoyltransferase complex ATPase subunit type 1 TsaE [Desulfobacterales bacterium]|jgi:tRNA threonylcarbamoyladenosine biosynthesis protein TsaE|nr:tRNA (adenosine(37)-N6)-threonylcarbamoyltransferase complex ATPase subunit type 1 TsaE [Desulfobacterales bacterium]